MPGISLTLPANGETIDAEDVNNPFNAIASLLNGGIDSTNISSLSGTKINAGTLSGSSFDTNTANGWLDLATANSSVTYNGGRNYSLVYTGDITSKVAPGMRLKFTRSTVAPTQATSLNGTTQYYSKTSPANMTFTDDFVVSAWVKLGSYNGSGQAVVSRYNGTSGWALYITATGQIQLQGYNAGSANASGVISYQSVPINRWVHITAQLDMSSFTASTTTSYIMIDGVDVLCSVARSGTNPTALVQAGNLEVGGQNGGTLPFNGKLAQVAIYNAKITQATGRGTIPQSLIGTETNLISAYSFNNTINDLNASSANNLTANSAAVATDPDSPFGKQASGTVSSTLEYGIIDNISFSTNTTLTVRTPSGNAIPTSGIASTAYSSSASPLGWPGIPNIISMSEITANFVTSATTATLISGLSITGYIPPGKDVKISAGARDFFNATGSAAFEFSIWQTSTSGLLLNVARANASPTQAVNAYVEKVFTPASPGNNTFVAAILTTNAADAANIEAAVTYPAYIKMELVDR